MGCGSATGGPAPIVIDAVLDRHDARVRRGVAISDYTTIRIGGVAGTFVEPRDARAAAGILRDARQAGIPYRVLGGGSNLLVGDGPIDGLVIHPALLNHVEICGSRVTAGAGITLAGLIAKTTDAGLGGLEALAGIPGQLGGAVAMNAGGRWGEIGPSVESVVLATPDGAIETAAGSDLAFAYRTSRIPAGNMIVSVTLQLAPGERAALKKRAGAILKQKNAAQPTTGWNFGCMFKNPPSMSAGRLVEACGLKGTARGGARISPLHGNFVENMGGATARDVLDLIELIEREVAERHGVTLDREVRVWNS